MNALDKATALAKKAHEQKAPRQFVKDFETVANHYSLKDLGEYELAKQTARDDIEIAIVCYSALAKEINKTY